MKRKAILTMIGALALVGCGGNSLNSLFPATTGSTSGSTAGTTGSTTSGAPPAAPGGTLRSLTPGATWNYALSGRLDIVSSDATKNFSGTIVGTMVRAVSNDIIGGLPALKITETSTYTGTTSANPPTTRAYTEIAERFYRQNADMSLTLLGMRFGRFDLTVLTTTFLIPGTWSATASVSGLTTLTSVPGGSADSRVSETLAFNGTVNVSTPAGSFGTWRIDRSENSEINLSPILLRLGTPGFPLGSFVTQGELIKRDIRASYTENWAPQFGSFMVRTESSTWNDQIVKSYTPPVVGPPAVAAILVHDVMDWRRTITATLTSMTTS